MTPGSSQKRTNWPQFAAEPEQPARPDIHQGPARDSRTVSPWCIIGKTSRSAIVCFLIAASLDGSSCLKDRVGRFPESLCNQVKEPQPCESFCYLHSSCGFRCLLSRSKADHFTFHYAFSVKNVQPGQKIEIWFPQAHSDQFQDVKIVSVTGDLPLKTSREAKFGNTIYHAIAPKSAKDEYTFEVQYDVVRHERIGLPRNGQQPQLVKASAKEASEYLAPDKLVPTTGKLADIAAQQVQGHTGTMDRARALYDYVFTTMKYDKIRHWLGARRRGMGLRLQARQLHRLPFGVHLDGALAGYSGALRNRFSAARQQKIRRHSRLPLLGRVL